MIDNKDIIKILVVTNIVTFICLTMVSQDLSLKIMPDIYNHSYEEGVFDCKNYSSEAKTYFEEQGFDVTVVIARDLELSTKTENYFHAFLRMDTCPIYILPQSREFTTKIEDRYDILFEIKDGVIVECSK